MVRDLPRWSDEDGQDALPYGPYDGLLASRLPAEGTWVPLRLESIEIRQASDRMILDLRGQPTWRRYQHRRPYTIQAASWTHPRELELKSLEGKMFEGRIIHVSGFTNRTWDQIDLVRGLQGLEMMVRPPVM